MDRKMIMMRQIDGWMERQKDDADDETYMMIK